VIGTDVAFPLLQAVADVPEEALRRSLAHLQAAEFLYETRLFPDVEYTFKHALTHDVAYGGLLQERRRALHARLVEAIERLHSDRLIEQVDRLVHHAVRGEVWEKVLAYGRKAGVKAFARSANREALTCWEQALAALAHLPQSRDTIEQAIDLRCDIRNALLLLGDLGRMFEYLYEAKALAETLGDQRRLGAVSSHLSALFNLTGDPERGIEAGRCTLDIATALGDPALRLLGNYRVGMYHHIVGDYRRAVGFMRRTVEALEGGLVQERLGVSAPASSFTAGRLVTCLVQLGEFAEAARIGQETLRRGEALNNPPSVVWASRGIGLLKLRKGELQEAIPTLEHSLLLCRTVDLPLMFLSAAAQLGYAYAMSGRA